MLERAVENWLAKATERSFQIPFCYMLSREGHTIVHVSRHCGMELGKDVLTVDEGGTPCAFQLKGGDISLKKWQEGVSKQVTDLVFGKVKHPSIDATGRRYRPFLVTNGKIEEEVWRAIGDLNETLEERSLPRLKTKVGGELVAAAKGLQSGLWPSELDDTKNLLELHLHDGRDVFPKEKLARLLESTLPFGENGEKPSKAACNRAIASASVLTALALSSFTGAGNYVAEVEAWTLYAAYVLALAEKWNLKKKYYKHEVEIALTAIKNSLENLAHEVGDRKYLVEGIPTVDGPFLRVRITWVVGLLCILGLWRRAEGEEHNSTDDVIGRFVAENLGRLEMWGEAAIPQFLAMYWYDRLINAETGRADRLLYILAEAITRSKLDKGGVLPDPYFEAKDWMPYVIDAQLKEVAFHHRYQLTKEPPPNFAGYSYTLEGLVHLLVQQNCKWRITMLWPDITKILLHHLEFAEQWHFYLWRSEKGKEVMEITKHPRHWDDLKAEASDASGSGLPELIRENPFFALLFIIVYPHRTNATILRWLNAELKKAVYRFEN